MQLTLNAILYVSPSRHSKVKNINIGTNFLIQKLVVFMSLITSVSFVVVSIQQLIWDHLLLDTPMSPCSSMHSEGRFQQCAGKHGPEFFVNWNGFPELWCTGKCGPDYFFTGMDNLNCSALENVNRIIFLPEWISWNVVIWEPLTGFLGLGAWVGIFACRSIRSDMNPTSLPSHSPHPSQLWSYPTSLNQRAGAALFSANEPISCQALGHMMEGGISLSTGARLLYGCTSWNCSVSLSPGCGLHHEMRTTSSKAHHVLWQAKCLLFLYLCFQACASWLWRKALAIK